MAWTVMKLNFSRGYKLKETLHTLHTTNTVLSKKKYETYVNYHSLQHNYFNLCLDEYPEMVPNLFNLLIGVKHLCKDLYKKYVLWWF